MRLHRDVRVQMIERAVRLLAAVPPTLVHPLDFLVTTTRTLVLLSAGDGDEGVDLGGGGQHVPAKCELEFGKTQETALNIPVQGVLLR